MFLVLMISFLGACCSHTLTDYCSYQVSFSMTLPSPQGQKLLETLPPRHFYIPLHNFEFHLLFSVPIVHNISNNITIMCVEYIP